MDTLTDVMVEYQVPNNVRMEFIAFFETQRAASSTGVQRTQELFARLSPELRRDAVDVMHSYWFDTVSWLRTMEVNQFHVAIAQNLSSHYYAPKERIAFSRELCILRRGVAILNGATPRGRGCVIGADLLIENPA